MPARAHSTPRGRHQQAGVPIYTCTGCLASHTDLPPSWSEAMKTLPRILICLILWLGIGVGQIAHAEGTVEKVVLPVGDLKV
ncbi:uncharacterized protein METZ01_LOCUS182101, partial [marine metagenome]